MSQNSDYNKRFNAELSRNRKQLKRSLNQYAKTHTKQETTRFKKQLDKALAGTYAKAYKGLGNKSAVQAMQAKSVREAYRLVASKTTGDISKKFSRLSDTRALKSFQKASETRFNARINSGEISKTLATAFFNGTKQFTRGKPKTWANILQGAKDAGKAQIQIGIDKDGNSITREAETIEELFEEGIRKLSERSQKSGFGPIEIAPDTEDISKYTASEIINMAVIMFR